MEPPGHMTSTPVDSVEQSGTQSDDSASDLLPKEGALLILPEGADRHVLRNESCFLNHAIQHAADWYRFAREHRGWIINDDALYLITGFHKARSWSLGTYENVTADAGLSAKFRAAQVGGDDIDIGTAYSWRTAQPQNRRIGPVENYGLPNQAVFIRGFKMALRTQFPSLRRAVSVKADDPSTRSIRTNVSAPIVGSTWITSFWGGGKTSEAAEKKGDASNPPTGQTSSTSSHEEVQGVPIEIQRLPEVSRVFHPCDVINKYLLQRQPSAHVAITHDSDWIDLLGLLTRDELKHEDHLRNAVSQTRCILSQDGTVTLGSRKTVPNMATNKSYYNLDIYRSELEWALDPPGFKLLPSGDPLTHALGDVSKSSSTGNAMFDWFSDVPADPQSIRCKWVSTHNSIICGESLPLDPKHVLAHFRQNHVGKGSESEQVTCCWLTCAHKMQRKSLLRHVLTLHFGLLKWQCETCEKVFSRKVKHMCVGLTEGESVQ